MWITLTPADLDGLAPTEIATLARIAGNVDKLPGFIDQVVREVRGYVGTRNPLGEDGTIPDELKDATVSLVIYRAVTAIPSARLLTDARKEAAENARTLLRDVAKGIYLVVAPTVAAPQQTSRPGVVTIQPGNQGNSREELRRL